MGGRDDPDVDGDRRAGCPAARSSRSSSTRRSFTWTVSRQVADLVEEDRRLVGQLEAADLPRQRAGEGALLAAEELALDERGGNGRAVHPDHRRPRRALSSCSRAANSSLPVPVSPSRSTVESVAADLLDLLQRPADGGSPRDHPRRPQPVAHLLPEADVLRFEPRLRLLDLAGRDLQRLPVLLRRQPRPDTGGARPCAIHVDGRRDQEQLLVGPHPVDGDVDDEARAVLAPAEQRVRWQLGGGDRP